MIEEMVCSSDVLGDSEAMIWVIETSACTLVMCECLKSSTSLRHFFTSSCWDVVRSPPRLELMADSMNSGSVDEDCIEDISQLSG